MKSVIVLFGALAALGLAKCGDVSVGVPFIVDLTRTQSSNATTDSRQTVLGILGGLIRVNVNRDINATSGERKGPVSVTIFGQTIETNGAQRKEHHRHKEHNQRRRPDGGD